MGEIHLDLSTHQQPGTYAWNVVYRRCDLEEVPFSSSLCFFISKIVEPMSFLHHRLWQMGLGKSFANYKVPIICH